MQIYINDTLSFDYGPGYPKGSWNGEIFTPNAGATTVFEGYNFQVSMLLVLRVRGWGLDYHTAIV